MESRDDHHLLLFDFWSLDSILCVMNQRKNQMYNFPFILRTRNYNLFNHWSMMIKCPILITFVLIGFQTVFRFKIQSSWIKECLERETNSILSKRYFSIYLKFVSVPRGTQSKDIHTWYVFTFQEFNMSAGMIGFHRLKSHCLLKRSCPENRTRRIPWYLLPQVYTWLTWVIPTTFPPKFQTLLPPKRDLFNILTSTQRTIFKRFQDYLSKKFTSSKFYQMNLFIHLW